jgi:large subunit ribosomal protein L22
MSQKKPANRKNFRQDGGWLSKAHLSQVRVSPQRARLVADLIRGKEVSEALRILDFCEKKTAPLLKRLIMSAVSNAKQFGADVDELVISRIWVNEGQRLKRSMPRAQGRATPIIKRFSSITVHLDEAA